MRGYSAEAKALFARMSNQPDATRKGHIDTLITALKTAGVWDKMDGLYLFAAHNSQAARLNWVADQYNCTAQNSPTFTVDRGYAGDGASSHLATGAIRNALAQLQQNSTHVAAWCRTEANANYSIVGSSNAGSTLILNPRQASALQSRCNDIASIIQAVPSSMGLSAINRSGSSARQAYKDGVSVKSDTQASTALASDSLYFLRNLSAYAALEVAFASIGSSLSADEHLALYNAVSTYMTAVGA